MTPRRGHGRKLSKKLRPSGAVPTPTASTATFDATSDGSATRGAVPPPAPQAPASSTRVAIIGRIEAPGSGWRGAAVARALHHDARMDAGSAQKRLPPRADPAARADQLSQRSVDSVWESGPMRSAHATHHHRLAIPCSPYRTIGP